MFKLGLVLRNLRNDNRACDYDNDISYHGEINCMYIIQVEKAFSVSVFMFHTIMANWTTCTR